MAAGGHMGRRLELLPFRYNFTFRGTWQPSLVTCKDSDKPAHLHVFIRGIAVPFIDVYIYIGSNNFIVDIQAVLRRTKIRLWSQNKENTTDYRQNNDISNDSEITSLTVS